MDRSPALTFALTLKRWFRANDWPQKITDDWANDPGVNYQHGPWASQICGALKGDGYNPRAEFFIALAVFNQAVKDQSFKGIQSATLKKRLTDSVPLTHDDGRLYSPTDFWSLFAGQIEPPAEYGESEGPMTQEDVDAAVKLMRDNFRQVSLDYMVSPATAWQMLHAAIVECGEKHGTFVSPDDIQQLKEVLAGLAEHTPETLVPIVQRYGKHDPVVCAFHVLLEDDAKKQQPIDLSKKRSAQAFSGQ